MLKSFLETVLFLISFCTFPVTSPINTPGSSIESMILIISFISSFETKKVDRFPALTAPFPLVFHSALFLAFEVKLLNNPDKLTLTKGIATFVSAFFPKLPDQQQKIHLIELF